MIDVLVVLVGVVTISVGILAGITGSVVYTNWKIARKYEQKVAKLLQGQTISMIGCYLVQLLLYSQQARRATNATQVCAIAPDARDVIGNVSEVMQQLRNNSLNLGKAVGESFRKEMEKVKYNFEKVKPSFKKSTQDLTEKCSEIIELMDRLSSD